VYFHKRRLLANRSFRMESFRSEQPDPLEVSSPSINDRHGGGGERIFSDPEGLMPDEIREQRKRKKKVKNKRRSSAASSRARSRNGGVSGSFTWRLQPGVEDASLESTERNESEPSSRGRRRGKEGHSRRMQHALLS